MRHAYIHGDDEVPEIDLIRHLLAYIYMIGWKGGFLFPSQDELNNPPADGIYKTCVTDDDLYTCLTRLYKLILGRIDKLGIHCLRKTAYLFAIFRFVGPHDLAEICKCAGHSLGKQLKTVMKYVRDATASKTQFRNDPEERVGEYKSSYSTGGSNAKKAAAKSKKFHKPLWEIARGFVEEEVGIHPTDPMAKNSLYLFTKVRAWRKVALDPAKELMVCIFVHFVSVCGLVVWLSSSNDI